MGLGVSYERCTSIACVERRCVHRSSTPRRVAPAAICDAGRAPPQRPSTLIVHKQPNVLLHPVDPSFRALHGRLKLTDRRQKFNKRSCSSLSTGVRIAVPPREERRQRPCDAGRLPRHGDNRGDPRLQPRAVRRQVFVQGHMYI